MIYAFDTDLNIELLAQGIRSELDDSPSTMNYKIRNAELQKIPYLIICGKREADLEKIAVGKHGIGNLGLLTTREFIKNIKSEQKLH